MIELQKPKLIAMPNDKHKSFPLRASPAFVESAVGEYTHRVRSAVLYNIHKHPHVAVRCWCGMTILMSHKGCHSKNTFVDEPTIGRPICATCEGRIIGAGDVDNFRINGRIVKYSPRYGA